MKRKNKKMTKRRCEMTNDEFYKLSSLVIREIYDFESEMLDKDSEYLYENAREIYATKFIGDYLIDYDFMKDKDYKLFPKTNVLNFIKTYYLFHHDEVRESDLNDMLLLDNDLKKAVKQNNPEM